MDQQIMTAMRAAPTNVHGGVRLMIEIADDRAAPAVIAETACEIAQRLGQPYTGDDPWEQAREASGARARAQAGRLLLDALLLVVGQSEERQVLEIVRRLIWANAWDYRRLAELWEELREEADRRADDYWARYAEEGEE